VTLSGGSSEAIVAEQTGRVGILKIDRPESRNALSEEVLGRLVDALSLFDADRGIGCIVIAGSERVFASGADIRLLAQMQGVEAYVALRARQWDAIRQTRTPLIAAVSGYCLGGGCELAMSCDLIAASETARFGLPETGLGLIPGAGGTQMLIRAVGKAKAMDMVLSGRLLSAVEAEQSGLVARVAAADAWLEEAIELAAAIGARPPVAAVLAKESIRRALDMPLEAGIESERRAFALALETDDAREGLTAFIEKREPRFSFSDDNQREAKR
jgi:enoyl-CoA hydratase